MGTREHLNTLVSGFQHTNAKLYDALRALISRVNVIEGDVTTYITSITSPSGETVSYTLSPPDSFSFSLPGSALELSWGDVINASQYELRKGASWNTADFVVRTSSLSVALVPIVSGAHTYLIKSIDSNGNYSINSTEVNLIIPTMGSTILTSQVIDNNVLLSWEEPTHPYSITLYSIYKDGVLVGTKTGTFTVLFETTAGSYTYGITATDLAGNVSDLFTTTISINQPPDFELIDLFDSTLTGTFDNTILVGTSILGPIHDTETWAEHFVDNSWTCIQDQIDAGYPIYIQPSESTGYYEEIIDYGTVFSNTIVTVAWQEDSIDPTVTVSCQICGSTDGSTYSAYVAGSSQYFSSLRYVKFKLTLTASDSNALILISSIQAKLSIKYATDSGNIEADSTDASGTFVAFVREFKDVNSITLSCLDTEPAFPIYDFTDVPDPTGFYAYVFDASGTRITRTISWKARGII